MNGKTVLAACTHINTKVKIMTTEGITLEFLSNLGIPQGDVLAPLIFIIVLDFILRLAIGPRGTRWFQSWH